MDEFTSYKECPECSAEAVLWNSETERWECEECQEYFLPENYNLCAYCDNLVRLIGDDDESKICDECLADRVSRD